ncbi:MAG: EpsG family protein [Bacteroidales bacterium]|nr:EpsG family protein [Bacteroidales bacterium]
MIAAKYYSTVFLYLTVILTVIVAKRYYPKTYIDIRENHENGFALILCILLTWWIGQRPLSPFFGDSYFYAHTYSMIKSGLFVEANDKIWTFITNTCAQFFDVHGYFTVVAIGYFGFTYLASKIATPNNVLVTVLFLLGTFSFYSYGVNGIRNGLACSIALSAIVLYVNNKKSLPLVIGLSIIAIGIHKSTLIPIASLFASTYFVKSFKQAYTFWIISILISLVAGNSIANFFANIGLDDSRTSYLTTQDEGMFSHSGFRWDFLIYSMMPIVLGYYIIIKRGIEDRSYEILLSTYTIANAFWVMVIRANYSNRFAYLSWFMYALVLAYPLLKLDIWGDEQGKYLSRIMLAQIGFTWFMKTFYWS